MNGSIRYAGRQRRPLRPRRYRDYPGEAFVLPEVFEDQTYAFALTSDSPLREPINRIILRRTSSPSWNDLLADYLGHTR